MEFPGSYEEIRRFLRYASYGCYSRNDLTQMFSAVRKYHNYHRLCMDVLPDQYQTTNYKKNKRPAIRGSSYDGNENFLAETYCLKTLTTNQIFLLTWLLHVLNTHHNKYGNGFSQNDIEMKLSPFISYELKRILEKKDHVLTPYLIRTHLGQLVQFGLVREIRLGKRKKNYALADDPFASLSANEVKALLFAVDYFKNTAFLSVPGYFLANTLCRRFTIAPNRHQPFHFTNLDIRRILDDDVVYQILLAIAGGKYLQFVWRHKKNGIIKDIPIAAAQPLEIREDELGDGRRQLIANFVYKPDKPSRAKPSRQLLRIEEISDLRLVDPISDLSSQQEEQDRKIEVSLRLHFHATDEKTVLMERIHTELPEVKICEDMEDHVLCKFSCRDTKKYLPLLRTFLPNIELLDTETSLHKHMRSGIEQALCLYKGHPSPSNEKTELYKLNITDENENSTASNHTLFQEVNAGMFHWLVDWHNRLCDKKKHGEKLQTLRQLLNDAPYNGAAHEALFCKYIMAAFDFEPSASAKKNMANESYELPPKDLIVVPPKNKIPILPTTLERRWLKTCLLTQEADLFLSKELKEKLLSSLSDIAPFDLSCWKRQPIWHPLDQRPSEIHTALTTVIYALRTHQGISFQKKNYIPLFLRQNASNGIYSLLLWDAQAHEPHIVSEEQLPLCIPTAMPYETFQEARQAWQTYLSENGRTTDDKKRNFVTIAFHDSRNARERTYTLFSAFDKKAFIEQDGSYHLTVYFCTFEQEDVLRRILSLGPYARVLEPTSIRDEIVRRLRKAQELYQREYGDPPQELDQ